MYRPSKYCIQYVVTLFLCRHPAVLQISLFRSRPAMRRCVNGLLNCLKHTTVRQAKISLEQRHIVTAILLSCFKCPDQVCQGSCLSWPPHGTAGVGLLEDHTALLASYTELPLWLSQNLSRRLGLDKLTVRDRHTGVHQ